MIRALAVAALIALPATASAQGILIESHGNARPADAGDLMAPVIRALADKKVSGGDRLRERIERELSAPAALVTDEHLATAERLVGQGEKLVGAKRQAQAIPILKAADDVYRAQPAAVAADPAVRDLAYRALAGYAAAQLAVGNDELAGEAATRMARSFPDRTPEGPLAAAVAKAGEALRAAGTGTLAVEVSDPSAEIFINERKVGTGTASIELPAGDYRVMARVGSDLGRLYRATVGKGATARVTVDWEIDRALRTEGDFVGLVFGSAEARTAGEKKVGLALARRLGAKQLVVATLRDHDGARSIVATAFDVGKGELLLAAAISLEPLSSLDARAAALASYLAGGPADGGVIPIGEVEGSGKVALPIAPPTDDGPSRRHLLWWGAAGTGVVLAGAGVWLLAIDGDGTCDLMPGQTQCPEVYSTTGLGIASLIGGLALAGAGTYFALTGGDEPSERRAIGLMPRKGGLTVSIGGRF